jgi:hypothetical protein
MNQAAWYQNQELKNTIVSASRPRNEEEKEKLKKSGRMLGYINLP